MDIAFLMDSSNSVSANGFKKISTFIQAIFSSLNISPSETHVAVNNFGKDVETVFDFKSGTSPEEAKGKLIGLTKLGGQRDLGRALNFIGDNVFNVGSGSRNVAEKVLVVVMGNEMDNYKDTNFLPSLKKLQDKNVKLVFVVVNTNEDVISKLSGLDSTIAVPDDFIKLPKYLGDVEKNIRQKGIVLFLSHMQI